MFTGLITGIGTVRDVRPAGKGKDTRYVIGTPANDTWQEAVLKLGASIACSGCCLTVTEFGLGWFAVEVSAETLSLTTLETWKQGSRVNLEGALRLGDEFGGHIVSGHVDGLATVLGITPENGSTRWRFLLAPELAPFVARKGSIAIDGVSLTVNEVHESVPGVNIPEFGVNIIPHTIQHTNFAMLAVGDKVNIEIDIMARYVARQLSFRNA